MTAHSWGLITNEQGWGRGEGSHQEGNGVPKGTPGTPTEGRPVCKDMRGPCCSSQPKERPIHQAQTQGELVEAQLEFGSVNTQVRLSQIKASESLGEIRVRIQDT